MALQCEEVQRTCPHIAGPSLAWPWFGWITAAQIEMNAGGCIVQPCINQTQPTRRCQKILFVQVELDPRSGERKITSSILVCRAQPNLQKTRVSIFFCRPLLGYIPFKRYEHVMYIQCTWYVLLSMCYVLVIKLLCTCYGLGRAHVYLVFRRTVWKSAEDVEKARRSSVFLGYKKACIMAFIMHT